MERLQLWGLLSLMVLSTAQNNRPGPRPSYLLLAPTSLRPDSPTSLSVSILTGSDVLVSAQILQDDQSLSSVSVPVPAGTTALLTLPPIKDKESAHRGYYTLEVKGHVGTVQIFSNYTKLGLDPRRLCSLIQTDKVKYKPGQEVKIRVVSVDPDGKPYDSPVEVLIKDPRGNRIRQWPSAESKLGVVSLKFKLSENPPLGEWTIVATVHGVSSEKHFSLENYQLPKFKVMIKAPDAISYEDVLMGSVTAKYMYGKPVHGYMNISVYFYDSDELYTEHTEIDGTESFSFDFSDDHSMSKRSVEMMLNDDGMKCLKIVVHVTDYITGLTYNSTAKVYVLKSRYKLSFECYHKTLKPSLSFNVKLRVSMYNDEPLAEVWGKVVEVSVVQERGGSWGWTGDVMEKDWADKWNSSGPLEMRYSPPPPEDVDRDDTQEFSIPADGVITLPITVEEDTQKLTVYASLEESYSMLEVHRSYSSPSHTYLQIQKPSRYPEVGSSLRLRIESNFKMPGFHYLVKSRGRVVAAGTSSGDLMLEPEDSWAPVACIIVYCVHPDGEVVNDVIHLPVIHRSHNQVSLSWSDAKKKPGQEVTLSFSAPEPNSLVGILVVDKATQYAGKHNDITKERLLEKMEELDYSLDDDDMMTMGDPYSTFKSCDVVVLTDASLHKMNHLIKPVLFEDEVHHQMEENHPMDHHPMENQHVRSYFPETWVWTDVTTGSAEGDQIHLTVPDSITTWVATAFVMSQNLGLGLVEQPAELTAFQDFFLSLNLPPCIIRGEELILEVVLFNYLHQPLKVRVIVARSEDFEFVLSDNDMPAMANVREMDVMSKSGATVLFPIRPLVLGEIDVTVKAVTFLVSDTVRRTLVVKAEGIEKSFSASLLLELDSESLSEHLTFSFPSEVVEGSERVSVKVVGDILGPSITGLDSLIQMPYGCGEQNMIRFAPNIYVLWYLNETGQNDQNTVERALNFMMEGYERQLSYQRDDGSFSAFGNDHDSSGSTWLSAFVLRCFLQAERFIPIDPRVVEVVAVWIVAQLEDDGSFNEPGNVIHTELQGGLDGSLSLTAYVLIALLENSDVRAHYETQVSQAVMFLETRLAEGVASNYSLSLVAYALALAGHSNAHTALYQLMGRAEVKDGVPMWSSLSGGVSSSWQPRSADIEMASYVLLTHHRLGLTSDGLPLLRWLSKQRNQWGGYGSTQDTIVALQALATLAALVGSQHHDLTITVSHSSSSSSKAAASFYINHENYLLHQQQQIEPEDELNLQVAAEGRGLVLFQLNVFYNVWDPSPPPMMARRRGRDAGYHEAFYLHTKLLDTETHTARLQVCYRLMDDLGLEATGMSIMEVELLSGFTLHPDGVSTDDVVKKVETKENKVVLYLSSVTTKETCLWIPMILDFKVGKNREVYVSIWDYYEPRRKTVTSYKSHRRSNMSVCSFCNGNCNDCHSQDYYDDYYDYYYYYTSAASRSGRRLLLGTVLPALLLLFIVHAV